jgi:glycogen debranching enzyme
MVRDHQPYVHDLVSCVSAPFLALSGADGQIRPGSAQGFYYSDRRLVDTLEVRVDDAEPTPISGGAVAAGSAVFTGVLRDLGDGIADPTVTIERRREVTGNGMAETVTLRNRATAQVRATLTVRCAGDLAAMATVKAGRAGSNASRPRSERTASGLSWSDSETAVHVALDPAPDAQDGDLLRWDVIMPPSQTLRFTATITCKQTQPGLFLSASSSGNSGSGAWSSLTVTSGDHRLARLVTRGLQDLDSLLLCDPLQPSDRFVGAGSPWFLTLFGRDALWAARFLLPLGTGLAASTLRTLARRQGASVDRGRDEEPGKILHEVRGAEVSAELPLPPVYYGTVDATPLWICLLCDAWRWGLSEEEVEHLLPCLERALAWMRDYADPDGDGFLEYVPHATNGLSNQGWKDSHDSVQWFDGRLAEGPIALCEVQGYAYEAASKAADILDAFGRPGADEWRTWAARLAARFRQAFWVEANTRDAGSIPYPAIALDRDKARIDTVSSNIGHLLSTGILDATECGYIAERLALSDMDCGWGLRTMTARSPRFNPLSYHGGSVWPHDTTIAICGLAAAGHAAVATSLARGVVRASEGFDYRLPELYGGYQAHAGRTAVPYPAACRPQAWAAASGVAILAAALGVRPDVRAGSVRVEPLPQLPFGTLDVDGLIVAGSRVRIRHDSSSTTIDGLRPDLQVVVVDGGSS